MFGEGVRTCEEADSPNERSGFIHRADVQLGCNPWDGPYAELWDSSEWFGLTRQIIRTTEALVQRSYPVACAWKPGCPLFDQWYD